MSKRDDLAGDEVEAFATAMWAPGFAVSVPRDQVRSFRTPMLVLPGVDEPHPAQRPMAGRWCYLSARTQPQRGHFGA